MKTALADKAKGINERYAILDQAAYKFGYNNGGLWLGAPIAIAAICFSVIPGLAGRFTADELLIAGICGLLWFSIPGNAFLSAAMSACPPAGAIGEQEIRRVSDTARVMLKQYIAIPIIVTLLLVFSQASYLVPLFSYARQAGRALPWGQIEKPLLVLAALLVNVVLLKVACRAGSRWGENARRGRNSRAERFLIRCWIGCRKQWEQVLP